MDNTDRRTFLQRAGLCSLSSLIASAVIADDDKPEPSNPPADSPHDLASTSANMGSLYPLIRQVADAGDYPYSFLSGRFQSLEEFKEAGREKVLAAFSYNPEQVEPNAEVIQRDDLGDFIREKLLFSTSPEFRVPAYLHIPKGLSGPAPAIVDLHSHGGMFLFGKEKVIDFGNNHEVMTEYHKRNYGKRPTTTELVRRGYVVITIDALMFGERRLILDEDRHFGWDRSQYSLDTANLLNQKCRSKESTIAKSLIYAGTTWPGIITYDDMRTVDYLVSRPEVDAARIGCVGVSLGGWRSLFLAGMDERIAAACVTGFMSTVRPMLHRHIDTHSFAHFVPGLHRYLDLPDVVTMLAPKPLLVQQCEQDGLFPLKGMRESVAKIASVYDRAGVKDRFTGTFHEGGHRFDVAMQNEAFDWFDSHLKPGR